MAMVPWVRQQLTEAYADSMRSTAARRSGASRCVYKLAVNLGRNFDLGSSNRLTTDARTPQVDRSSELPLILTR